MGPALSRDESQGHASIVSGLIGERVGQPGPRSRRQARGAHRDREPRERQPRARGIDQTAGGKPLGQARYHGAIQTEHACDHVRLRGTIAPSELEERTQHEFLGKIEAGEIHGESIPVDLNKDQVLGKCSVKNQSATGGSAARLHVLGEVENVHSQGWTAHEPSAVDDRPAAIIRVVLERRIAQTVFRRGVPGKLWVGSDDAATLRLERTDVAPRQLDVIWDGSQLWLQDALRLGRTFVNGRTLNEWFPVVGHAVVCFGGVRMWIISHAAPPNKLVPDFAALDRARLTEPPHTARQRLSETGRFTVPPSMGRLRPHGPIR